MRYKVTLMMEARNPKTVVNAVKDAITKLPEEGIDATREAVAEKFGVPITSVNVEAIRPPGSRADRYDAAIVLVENGKADLEDLHSELEEWKENLPEQFQDGDKGQALDEAMEALQQAIDACQSVVDCDMPEFPQAFG